MPSPKLDLTINLGHVITFGGLLVTMAIGWATFDGRLVEVELENDDGRTVYEIELLTKQGSVIELTYDARTGRFLEAEGKGVSAARKQP